MSSIVVARDLSFEFSNGRELFRNLNLSLDARRSALVGPNGIGKTCLARLLLGEIEPTAGVVRRNGSIMLVRQREAPTDVTVGEYLAADYEWSLLGDRLLQRIDLAARCTRLSGGQWMRVRLAKALGADFLVLDEPTNDLDREGRDTVLQFLCAHHAGVLLISHDRECLALCDEVLELSTLGLTKFTGGWAAYLDSKAREYERSSTALEGAKRERDRAAAHRAEQKARQERRNRRGAAVAARGGLPKILLGARKQRAQATTTRLDAAAMEKSDQAVRAAHEAFAALKVDAVMYSDAIGRELPAQKLVASADGFNIRFQDWIYAEDLSFSWRGNVRVAVKGANGSGKTALLKALLGEQFEARGELRRGGLACIHIDQDRSALDDDVTVFDNIRAVCFDTDAEIRNQLARFLFSGDTVLQNARELSGGERLRAALARGLLSARRPELMVLDEPTNNLDRANVEFLERIVSEFQGAVVVVSHDESFLERCGVECELKVVGRRQG